MKGVNSVNIVLKFFVIYGMHYQTYFIIFKIYDEDINIIERVGMFFALKLQTFSHNFVVKCFKCLLWILVQASFSSYQLNEYFIATFILSKNWMLIVLHDIPHCHPQCVLLHRNSYNVDGVHVDSFCVDRVHVDSFCVDEVHYFILVWIHTCTIFLIYTLRLVCPLRVIFPIMSKNLPIWQPVKITWYPLYIWLNKQYNKHVQCIQKLPQGSK